MIKGICHIYGNWLLIIWLQIEYTLQIVLQIEYTYLMKISHIRRNKDYFNVRISNCKFLKIKTF